MNVAAIRPDSWDFPLFLHVTGAMLLVGALVVVAATTAPRCAAATASRCSPDSPSARC